MLSFSCALNNLLRIYSSPRNNSGGNIYQITLRNNENVLQPIEEAVTEIAKNCFMDGQIFNGVMYGYICTCSNKRKIKALQWDFGEFLQKFGLYFLSFCDF